MHSEFLVVIDRIRCASTVTEAAALMTEFGNDHASEIHQMRALLDAFQQTVVQLCAKDMAHLAKVRRALDQ